MSIRIVLALVLCFLFLGQASAIEPKKKAEITHAYLTSASVPNPVSAPAVTSAGKPILVNGKFYNQNSDGTLTYCKECNLDNCPNGQCASATTCQTGNCSTQVQSEVPVRRGLFGSCGGSSALQLGSCGGSSRGPVRTIVGFPFRLIRGIFGGCGG